MSLIDEQIKDAIRKGQFADLPGAGKPLRLEDESHVPEHLRMAHRLLSDNNFVPEWMAQGQELDAARAKLSAELGRAIRANQLATIEALRETAKKHNRLVLSYNLKVPNGVVHKRHFDFEQEVQKAR